MNYDTNMAKFTVSDGKLMLTLEEAPEGGFTVTSPLDPGLVTEAETISEAFFMARDALKELGIARRQIRREIAEGLMPAGRSRSAGSSARKSGARSPVRGKRLAQSAI